MASFIAKSISGRSPLSEEKPPESESARMIVGLAVGEEFGAVVGLGVGVDDGV